MSKLTLSLDQRIIEKAKSFAKRSNRSLSEIVESYLDRITSVESDCDKELDDIRGIITLDSDFDDKKAIRNILTNKHL